MWKERQMLASRQGAKAKTNSKGAGGGQRSRYACHRMNEKRTEPKYPEQTSPSKFNGDPGDYSSFSDHINDQPKRRVTR